MREREGGRGGGGSRQPGAKATSARGAAVPGNPAVAAAVRQLFLSPPPLLPHLYAKEDPGASPGDGLGAAQCWDEGPQDLEAAAHEVPDRALLNPTQRLVAPPLGQLQCRDREQGGWWVRSSPLPPLFFPSLYLFFSSPPSLPLSLAWSMKPREAAELCTRACSASADGSWGLSRLSSS